MAMPTNAAPALPILATIGQTFRLLWLHRDDFIRVAIVPVVLAGLLIFTCLAVLHVRKHPTTAVRGNEAARLAPIGWLAAGILAYLLLAERGGFVVASAALFWLTARAFDSRRPLRDAAFSVVISVGAYLVFARVLQLSLPAGVFAGWL